MLYGPLSTNAMFAGSGGVRESRPKGDASSATMIWRDAGSSLKSMRRVTDAPDRFYRWMASPAVHT